MRSPRLDTKIYKARLLTQRKKVYKLEEVHILCHSHSQIDSPLPSVNYDLSLFISGATPTHIAMARPYQARRITLISSHIREKYMQTKIQKVNQKTLIYQILRLLL